MSYTKATAKAIKGDYSKNLDLPAKDRYTSINKFYFQMPKISTEEGIIKDINRATTTEKKFEINDPSSKKIDNTSIYKSKIARIPTVGYSGHQSIFQKTDYLFKH